MSNDNKSQDELSLVVFAAILLKEDVPYDVVRQWVVDHTPTVINFRQLGLGLGLKVKAYFQRKSGDASTLHGSSCVLAVALAWCFDDAGVVLKLIRGDDSFLLRTHERTNLTANLSSLTDLLKFECAVLDFEGSMYNCSDSISFASGFVRFVPHLLKAIAAIVKLGRFDMFCCPHVREYFYSFRDKHRALPNSVVQLKVADWEHRRAPHARDVLAAYFTGFSFPRLRSVLHCARAVILRDMGVAAGASSVDAADSHSPLLGQYANTAVAEPGPQIPTNKSTIAFGPGHPLSRLGFQIRPVELARPNPFVVESPLDACRVRHQRSFRQPPTGP